jgi:hypothetical protein
MNVTGTGCTFTGRMPAALAAIYFFGGCGRLAARNGRRFGQGA